MNILTDKLQDKVTVGDHQLGIETDFRAAIKFEMLTEQGVDDIHDLMKPFFPSCDPHFWRAVKSPERIIEAALWFYRGGEEIPAKTEKTEKKPPSYSFAVDADTIFADFWRYYGLDLSTENVHWWVFRALLAGLPEDSGYKQRIYYRTCDLKGLPKAEQARIRRIRAAIAINSTGKMTLEERNEKMREQARMCAERAKGG